MREEAFADKFHAMHSKVPLKASSGRSGRKVSVWEARCMYTGVVYITKRNPGATVVDETIIVTRKQR